MMFLVFAFAITAVFFVSALLLLNFGRYLGLRYLEQAGAAAMSGLPTVESAVFALIGLLLAFTISGALQRFDERRELVVKEATAISTAYDRLSLFEDDAPDLQARLKEYTRARIDLYRMPHDLSVWHRTEDWSPEQIAKIVELKNSVWNATVETCPVSHYQPACSLTLPALATVFEVARQRLGAAEKHPPQVVHFMLFVLALGGSLLAGFGMAAASARSWLHMVVFAGTMSITLYVMTDMEYPRLGLIRIENFDHFLVDVYDQMRFQNPRPSALKESLEPRGGG